MSDEHPASLDVVAIWERADDAVGRADDAGRLARDVLALIDEREEMTEALREVVAAADALTGLDFALPSGSREAVAEIQAGMRMTNAVQAARTLLGHAGEETSRTTN